MNSFAIIVGIILVGEVAAKVGQSPHNFYHASSWLFIQAAPFEPLLLRPRHETLAAKEWTE